MTAVHRPILTPHSSFFFFFIQIEKFGDPNGIIQFSEEALQERVYNESTEEEGPLNISLSVKRREGVMGNITVGVLQYCCILHSSHSVRFHNYCACLSSCGFFLRHSHVFGLTSGTLEDPE